MTNIINSHNLNINNTTKSFKNSFGKQNIYDEFDVVTLPKFSIDKVLQEKDEFRHQIKTELHNKQEKEKMKPGKTGIIIAALTGIILLLFGRKGK